MAELWNRSFCFPKIFDGNLWKNGERGQVQRPGSSNCDCCQLLWTPTDENTTYRYCKPLIMLVKPCSINNLLLIIQSYNYMGLNFLNDLFWYICISSCKSSSKYFSSFDKMLDDFMYINCRHMYIIRYRSKVCESNNIQQIFPIHLFIYILIDLID